MVNSADYGFQIVLLNVIHDGVGLILKCPDCYCSFKGFIYKYFAVLGSESCHLLFIAGLLLLARFLATVVQ